MLYSRSPFFWVLLILAAITFTACDALVSQEPEIAALPTLTPSPFMSITPAVGDVITPTPSTPTITATITLTPQLSPTPLFAALPTFAPGDLSAVPGGTDLPIPKPKINYFVSFPTAAAPGETVLLFWSTSGATTAAVTRVYETGKRGQAYAVSVEGSITITVDAKDRNQEYMLSISNGIVTVTKTLVIEVKCQVPWFFVPFPDTGCPDGDPSFGAAAIVDFQNGKMFWIGPTNQIVVLFNDYPKKPDPNQPAWIMVGNPFSNGMPEDDPSLNPPEGLKRPRRGYLMVWRDTPGVADRLGWAVDDESPYGIIYSWEQGDQRHFYFSDPGNAVIDLAPNAASWAVVGQVGTPTPEPTP